MNISKYQKIFGIGPIGATITFVVFGLLWVLDSGFGPAKLLVEPESLRIIGFFLIGIWICWHIWAVRTIRLWWTGDQLCKSGPYQYVRHPMYAGAVFLFCPGIAILFNSWIMLFWPLLMYPIWSVLVRKEERIMSATFGEDYRDYASRTGRLFPRILRRNRIPLF